MRQFDDPYHIRSTCGNGRQTYLAVSGASTVHCTSAASGDGDLGDGDFGDFLGGVSDSFDFCFTGVLGLGVL